MYLFAKLSHSFLYLRLKGGTMVNFTSWRGQKGFHFMYVFTLA